MTTLDERAKRGAEVRARFGGGTPSSGSVPASREMAPDLHRIAEEALFGSIWQRPGLKIEHREMIVLSVLTVLQRENQLRRHVANAVNLGLPAQQVIEVMIHASFYGGVPAAFTAMGVAQEVFTANDIPFTPQLVFDPNETPDDLYQRGVDRREELMGAPTASQGPGPVTQAEREFNRLTTEYYWGSVWNRPGLRLTMPLDLHAVRSDRVRAGGPVAQPHQRSAEHWSDSRRDHRGVHSDDVLRWSAFH